MSSVEEKRSSLVLGRDEKHQNSSSQVRMKFSLKHTIVIVMFHGFSPAGSCNISPKRSPVTLSCWMHRGETTSTSNRKDTMNGTSISVNLKSFMDVSLHSFLHVFKCTSFTKLKKINSILGIADPLPQFLVSIPPTRADAEAQVRLYWVAAKRIT